MGIVVEAQRQANHCVMKTGPMWSPRRPPTRPKQATGPAPGIGRHRRRSPVTAVSTTCAGVAGSACRPQRAAESDASIADGRPDHRHCRNVPDSVVVAAGMLHHHPPERDRYQLGSVRIPLRARVLFKAPPCAVQRVTDCVTRARCGSTGYPHPTRPVSVVALTNAVPLSIRSLVQ